MEDVDVDKILQLKDSIVQAFALMIVRAQKGYPIDDYTIIVEAMQALNLIANYTLKQYKIDTIVDFYQRQLNKL